jgi:hypothetical protein
MFEKLIHSRQENADRKRLNAALIVLDADSKLRPLVDVRTVQAIPGFPENLAALKQVNRRYSCLG